MSEQHSDKYENFDDLLPLLRPGYALRKYISPDNPNNRILHVRAIVDEDQAVVAWWSYKWGGCWVYEIVWIGVIRGWIDEGWITPAGKSRCSLPPL